MDVRTTSLDGVLLITPPTIFEDFRGSYTPAQWGELRQKLGGVNLTYSYVRQLPTLPRELFANPSPCFG